MSRISGYGGNSFYRTTFMNGRIFRSTGQSYSANLLSSLSQQNPKLARKIFSNFIDKKSNSTADTAKNALNDYDKKISDDVKKIVAAQVNQTPLYTDKSSLQAGYYSTLGNMFNYLS